MYIHVCGDGQAGRIRMGVFMHIRYYISDTSPGLSSVSPLVEKPSISCPG